METQNVKIKGTNVAPSSTSGHYVQDAIKVVNLDEQKEMFFVEGKSKLVTKNHTTLIQNRSCL